MSTIVNTPPSSGDSSMAVLVVGVLFTVAVVILFIIYGVPAIQRMSQPEPAAPTTIDIQLPTPTEPTAPAPEPAPTTTP